MQPFLKQHYQHFQPILIALALLFLAEAILCLPPIQTKLDFLSGNLLPRKLRELDSLQAKGAPVKVLALGTSRTLNGFHPKLFQDATSQPTYNMGLPQAGYDLLLLYLRDHVGRYGKPRLVLLEIHPYFLRKHYVSVDFYYHDLFWRNPQLVTSTLEQPAYPLQEKIRIGLSSFNGLYRYRLALSPSHLKTTLSGQPLYNVSTGPLQQGWEPLYRTNFDAWEKRWAAAAKKNPPIFNTHDLNLLLDYCRKQTIPMVLVQFPQRRPFPDKHIQQHLHNISRKYQIPYIDGEQFPGIHAPGFYAAMDHLNPKGAAYFSRLLTQHIIATKVLQHP